MTTTKTTLTGWKAIEAAEARGVFISKHSDPTEGERHGLTPDEAREIAAEDPGLIYLAADAQRIVHPADYVLAHGWDFGDIEATAERGVADEDLLGLSEAGLTPEALVAYCQERVIEAGRACAICTGSGPTGDGFAIGRTEITRDRDRDGLGTGKVYACDACVEAGTDEDREAMGVTPEEWAAVRARLGR